jgi:hypothetical protein
MGCLCVRIKRNSIPKENNLLEKISSINEITNSKYFYSITNLKIEFTLINKNIIQVDIVNKYTNYIFYTKKIKKNKNKNAKNFNLNKNL